jgi:hypothetical protein
MLVDVVPQALQLTLNANPALKAVNLPGPLATGAHWITIIRYVQPISFHFIAAYCTRTDPL